jgi:urease beta subunit
MKKKKVARQDKSRSPQGRSVNRKMVSAPKNSRGAPELRSVVPGEVMLGEGEIEVFKGRRTVELVVANTGDRPIQVGSHCHFFEVNRALRFEREKAFGFRLLVPAGTAVRFEPGEEKRVALVAFGGNRVVYGINGLTNGRLDDPQVMARALAAARERGWM